MPLMLFSDMQTEVRDINLDTDTSNYGVDDPTLKRVINRCYSHIRGFQDGRVYYISSTVSGANLAPQLGSMFTTLTETNYKTILEVYPAQNNASTQPYGPALSRVEQWELFVMQQEDPTDRGIYGSIYAAWRQGSTVAANVGKFNLGVWPLSSVAYDYLLAVLKEVTALVNGTDKADVSEEEGHYTTDMAAAICARLLGRPEEFIGQILTRLPEELQTASTLISQDIAGVKPRPGQVAA
jgi:hypothetical protein